METAKTALLQLAWNIGRKSYDELLIQTV